MVLAILQEQLNVVLDFPEELTGPCLRSAYSAAQCILIEISMGLLIDPDLFQPNLYGVEHNRGVHLSPDISGEPGNNLGAELMPLVFTCGFVQRGQDGPTKECNGLTGKQSSFQVGCMSRAAQDLL